jgi:hypothetical protein
MGGSFGERLRNTLGKSELHGQSDKANEAWRLSHVWRIDCLEQAGEITRRLGGNGIRRAELWNTVGRQLEYLDADEEFRLPSQLVDAAKQTGDHATAEHYAYSLIP